MAELENFGEVHHDLRQGRNVLAGVCLSFCYLFVC